MRVRRGIVTRLLHVGGEPVVVRAWQRRDGPIAFHAVASGAGDREHLEIAIERMRFALGVDDDYRELYDAFRSDRLLGGGDPAEALAPAPAPALGLGGARLVDHEAADRVLARGRDPAPDGAAMGSAIRGGGWRARCATFRPRS